MSEEHSEIVGLSVAPTPRSWTPLEAVAVIKCLDASGKVALVLRATPALSTWEGVGMLTATLDAWRDRLDENFVPDGDDPSAEE